ncbi:protein of unknown function [Shewanella benthica]|uniref:Uncharacterized protein n=1 Tax=Shewanella benthica TaxID=43661 RepID=A0A330LZM7_9GAMM|nr:protein of unknown function [Shewanella benthica]
MIKRRLWIYSLPAKAGPTKSQFPFKLVLATKSSDKDQTPRFALNTSFCELETFLLEAKKNEKVYITSSNGRYYADFTRLSKLYR